MRRMMCCRVAVVVLLVACCFGVQAQEVVCGAQRTTFYMPLLRGQRVAVVANGGSVLTSQRGKVHLVDTLLHADVALRRIFCPEHGFRGTAEAGAHVEDGRDAATGLPIVSLYGKNRKPTAEQLADIDVVLFDLQDVGCRFYTYISTLHYVMEACAEQGKRVIVLDRPNPNGHYVDGPVLDTSLRSFVGMHPVPIVYGLTVGEYAQMINGERWLKGAQQCALTVVPLLNYSHRQAYALPDDAEPPSPNLVSKRAVWLYPGLCLFEGTTVSVGRGTDDPFTVVGTPTSRLHESHFTPRSLPGRSAHPLHEGKRCYGPDLSGAALPADSLLLWPLLRLYESTPHKGFFLNNGFFDLLAGTRQLRRQIEQGLSEAAIRTSWQADLQQYRARRKLYLLYPDFD